MLHDFMCQYIAVTLTLYNYLGGFEIRTIFSSFQKMIIIKLNLTEYGIHLKNKN
jgi:hypothetical protein